MTKALIGRILAERFQRVCRSLYRAKPVGPTTTLILMILLGVVVISLAWLGYRATQEWRRNAAMAAQRRADEVAALLSIALTMDMVGVQQSTLSQFGVEQQILRSPTELTDAAARAFATFSYPESFFVWKTQNGKDSAAFFNRTDRLPPWDKSSRPENAFPVTIVRDSPQAYRLASLARQYALVGRDFALFETTIGEARYQIVARLFYAPGSRTEIVAVFGFTVNLDWIGGYFAELTDEIYRIGGEAGATSLSLSIIDENGTIVTETQSPKGRGSFRQRRFPLAFFDSSVVPVVELVHLPIRWWEARVSASDDAFSGTVDSGARQTSFLILFAAAVSLVGLLFAINSIRTNVKLSEMKSNFVAMVSHDLKTPLAGISLVSETLLNGRHTSKEEIADYATLLSRQSTRLKRLVDNLLSFSRITNSNTYAMAGTDVPQLVTEALIRLQPLIQEASCDVKCEFPGRLSNVQCDREAIVQVFENLIENAIKYSCKSGQIQIHAFDTPGHANVVFKDSGIGISAEDIPYIFDSFFRGKNAVVPGNGLGLSIAHKIVKDHHGHIHVDSALGRGTVMTVILPAISEGAN